ncbi:MAG: hydroxymethylglutaryl-CoA lyase [Pseudomonadota bacterium]
MAEFVEIYEVGPRDGLQNEAAVIPVAQKVALVDALSGVGFRRIEVGSFVSPKWVPQMADSGVVMGAMRRVKGVRYLALAPNLRGLEAAEAAGADEVAVFLSASEGFSRANINCSAAESIDRARAVVRAATVPVRGYVSCVVECPYDGAVAPDAVVRVAEALIDMGCHEVSLGDTIGRGVPDAVDAMLGAVCDAVDVARLAGHFHDTSGRALENVDVALARGVRVFDAAVGGLGGCPYAPGAAGNVATEAVDTHLKAQGYETGLDADLLGEAAGMAKEMRGV